VSSLASAVAPTHPPSFPTRRSSDLGDALLAEDIAQETFMKALRMMDKVDESFNFGGWVHTVARNLCFDELRRRQRDLRADGTTRSEEHTSELQSRVDLVCRLLLEKK